MLNYLVKNAKYIDNYKVWLLFADGKSGEVDLSKKLENKGKIFEPLKNIDYFKNFKITGSTISWENGADFAPESLYKLLKTKQKQPNK